ncbi:MAG: DNA polymerase III subunit delta', partial [Paracoccaceae bacterium]
LAWRMARVLLATPPATGGLFTPSPPTTLDIAQNHPVARRMEAGSEPGLFVLRRPWDDKAKRLKSQITIDEVRKLKGFFALSAADGGRRVVIVDAADDMNTNAANALLKVLEEPPKNALLILVAHQPAGLLPTIRSRCRTLRLGTLQPHDMAQALKDAEATIDPSHMAALAELAQGSVGDALHILQGDGLKLYSDLVATLGTLPRMDRARVLALADRCAGRQNEARLDMTLRLLDQLLARLARTGALGHAPTVQAAPGESTVLSRLAPDAAAGRIWAARAQDIGDRARHARAVNVDGAALMLDALLALEPA